MLLRSSRDNSKLVSVNVCSDVLFGIFNYLIARSQNVGGTLTAVLRRTFTSVEGSLLASRFSGRWDDSIEKDRHGNFFIDQPIELFLPMIKYQMEYYSIKPNNINYITYYATQMRHIYELMKMQIY